jgi:hypothetical protein
MNFLFLTKSSDVECCDGFLLLKLTKKQTDEEDMKSASKQVLGFCIMLHCILYSVLHSNSWVLFSNRKKRVSN